MDKFWERYIQSRPAPGSSKGAFDAFAAAHRDPVPRTMAQEPRIGFDPGGPVRKNELTKVLTDAGITPTSSNFSKVVKNLDIKKDTKHPLHRRTQPIYIEPTKKELIIKKKTWDKNQQRLAEVMATVDEGLIMQQKGMGPETIIHTIKDSWKRKKQALGGLAGLLGE